MHLWTLLPLMVSFGVAVSAKTVLSVRVQCALDRENARDSAIDHEREESAQEISFDGQQRAILEKWQRRFSGAMSEADWQIAA